MIVAEVNEAENRLDTADAVGECSVHCESVMLSELDHCTFKTQPKRRLEQRPSDEQAKRGFNCDLSQTDTESESDFSECSVMCSLPQSGFSSRSYSADDIKSFVKETKKCTTPNQKKLGQYGKRKLKKKVVISKFTLTCISLQTI